MLQGQQDSWSWNGFARHTCILSSIAALSLSKCNPKGFASSVLRVWCWRSALRERNRERERERNGINFKDFQAYKNLLKKSFLSPYRSKERGTKKGLKKERKKTTTERKETKSKETDGGSSFSSCSTCRLVARHTGWKQWPFVTTETEARDHRMKFVQRCHFQTHLLLRSSPDETIASRVETKLKRP